MRAVHLTAVLALTLGLLTAHGASARPGIDDRWRAEMDKVDERLRAGNWKSGRRSARRLAERILGESWHGRGLKEVLSELALYQAVAEANLGNRQDAVWSWHMAQNVDHRIRKRDLSPYGEAEKLLREFPLRARGQVPLSFHVVRRGYGPRFSRPVLAKGWAPALPHNSAAQRERVPDLHLEIIVDRRGQAHHPVVLSGDPNPVILYGVLDAMRTMPRFEPARDSGKPVDSLFKYVVDMRYSRWNQGGEAFTGKVN